MYRVERPGLYLMVIVIVLMVWDDSEQHQEIQDDIRELKHIVIDRTPGPGSKLPEPDKVVSPQIHLPAFCQKELNISPMSPDLETARECVDLYIEELKAAGLYES